jgi:hypothetical protein
MQASFPMAQLGRIHCCIWEMSTNANNRKAPAPLTGCGPQTPKGFFECVDAVIIEVRPAVISGFHLLESHQTILLTMIFLKTRNTWTFVGTTRLIRSLVLHGTVYYIVLGLGFSLEIFASMNNKVSSPMSNVIKRTLPLGYSFTIL